MMKSHLVKGGGGIQLHVIEAGNPAGRPVLFTHGLSQCSLAWARQITSDLSNTFRLVAMDIRGHGLSGKPPEGYGDSKLWAEDIYAAIHALNLDHPLLCGWSYGPLLILDYIRHYGEDDISGVNFIGGITKLGSDEAAAVMSGDFLSLIPGFFTTDSQESLRALDSLLSMCLANKLAVEERYRMPGYNVSVPPYVRQALFSRSFDNDDLLPKIRKPVLITHGTDDPIVRAEVINQQMARINHAQVQMMANAGHACFWNDAATYNQHLRQFVEAIHNR